MRIYNQTKNYVLANRVIMANTFFKRLKGLLGLSEMPKDTAMIIKPCKQVHMWFMRFSILAVFINDKGVVLHTQCLRPWQISKHVSTATAVIEMSHQNSTMITTGDVIKLIN